MNFVRKFYIFFYTFTHIKSNCRRKISLCEWIKKEVSRRKFSSSRENDLLWNGRATTHRLNDDCARIFNLFITLMKNINIGSGKWTRENISADENLAVSCENDLCALFFRENVVQHVSQFSDIFYFIARENFCFFWVFPEFPGEFSFHNIHVFLRFIKVSNQMYLMSK